MLVLALALLATCSWWQPGLAACPSTLCDATYKPVGGAPPGRTGAVGRGCGRGARWNQPRALCTHGLPPETTTLQAAAAPTTDCCASLAKSAPGGKCGLPTTPIVFTRQASCDVGGKVYATLANYNFHGNPDQARGLCRCPSPLNGASAPREYRVGGRAGGCPGHTAPGWVGGRDCIWARLHLLPPLFRGLNGKSGGGPASLGNGVLR
jgi:hypothetical protein